MPSFFRKKQPPAPPRHSPAFHSVEHLPAPHDDHDPRFSTHPSAPPTPSHPPSQSQSQTQSLSQPESHVHPPPQTQAQSHSFLRRSRSQRHPKPADPPVTDPAWPPSDRPDDTSDNPRRSRRSLFTFHSSPPSKESVKESVPSAYPERNQSLRSPRPQRPLSVDTDHPPASRSREYVHILETTPQSPMPQDTSLSRPPHPPFIQRSHTDSLENLYRPSPVDPSRPPAELTPAVSQLDHIRPPSRQSVGPPSPLRPLPSQSDTASQTGMSERPSGGAQGPPANHGSGQETGYRNNNSTQPSEPGRSTPSSQRGREDELDLKTLLQKHEELQTKYSKVKRYYFEKDAQVQHLQNTVAHQRMAVSRTVLDDNEYANRFGRLDGAIKDLAFSIRKDWTSIPTWFQGYVNEDAHRAGTKEMMAIGRAVMSRWLVQELFERYFHPALEITLSQQLKSIEMNLRNQQHGKSFTEEDKENAVARISNWRRTTLDGLTDALQGPAADEYRVQLTNRLVDSLVATLSAHLCDPPPAGLENAVRMIVENAVGIADKIPLESRDICIEYVLPGTPLREQTMKIETGIKPLAGEGAPVRGSTEQERHPEAGGAGAEDENNNGDRESSGSPSDNPAGRSKRSVLSSLMGRKPGPAAPSGNGDAGRPEERLPTRVRLSSFVLAEVRGRGPMNVLVKAPVYLVE